MKEKIIYCFIFIVFIILSFSISVDVHNKTKDVQYLQEQLSLRDEYIKSYLDKMYFLKDEVIRNQSNEKIIRDLDNLSYDFCTKTNLLDYNLYALDIMYYQENLRKKALFEEPPFDSLEETHINYMSSLE